LARIDAAATGAAKRQRNNHCQNEKIPI